MIEPMVLVSGSSESHSRPVHQLLLEKTQSEKGMVFEPEFNPR